MRFPFPAALLIVFFKVVPARTPTHTDIWVVWNVGQGQWVTHVLSDECRHYDVGGEFGSFTPLKRRLIFNCGHKMNVLHLSHWDFDHFLNIPLLVKTLPRTCWKVPPSVPPQKAAALKILKLNIPPCHAPYSGRIWAWAPQRPVSSNDSSWVFWDRAVLLPGDSSQKQETHWGREFPPLPWTRVLVLGHHGSRTSTGKLILRVLSGLKWAIASARFGKYRHPHKDTLQRLKGQRIPVLKTEDWGNIWFTSPDGQMRPDSDSQ